MSPGSRGRGLILQLPAATPAGWGLSRAEFLSQPAGHQDAAARPVQQGPHCSARHTQGPMCQPGGGHVPAPGRGHQELPPHFTDCVRLPTGPSSTPPALQDPGKSFVSPQGLRAQTGLPSQGAMQTRQQKDSSPSATQDQAPPPRAAVPPRPAQQSSARPGGLVINMRAALAADGSGPAGARNIKLLGTGRRQAAQVPPLPPGRSQGRSQAPGQRAWGPGPAGRGGALQEGWACNTGRQRDPGLRGHRSAGQSRRHCPAEPVSRKKGTHSRGQLPDPSSQHSSQTPADQVQPGRSSPPPDRLQTSGQGHEWTCKATISVDGDGCFCPHPAWFPDRPPQPPPPGRPNRAEA